METLTITLPELELVAEFLSIVVGLIIIPRMVKLITDFIPFIGN